MVVFVWHSFKHCRLGSPFLEIGLLFVFIYRLLLFCPLFLSPYCSFICTPFVPCLKAVSSVSVQGIHCANTSEWKELPFRHRSIFLKGKPCYPQLQVCTVRCTKTVPFGMALSPAAYDGVWIEEQRNNDKGASWSLLKGKREQAGPMSKATGHRGIPWSTILTWCKTSNRQVGAESGGCTSGWGVTFLLLSCCSSQEHCLQLLSV